jgi:hypothetical protein
MTALNHRRITGGLRRRDHPDWCARDHQCGLGEHRADPLAIAIPGFGRAMLTRVRGADGREHAEVRLTVALTVDESTARVQLLSVARDLHRLIGRAADIA